MKKKTQSVLNYELCFEFLGSCNYDNNCYYNCIKVYPSITSLKKNME